MQYAGQRPLRGPLSVVSFDRPDVCAADDARSGLIVAARSRNAYPSAMRTVGRGGRWVGLVLACIMATLVGGLGFAGAAAAHGDEGEMTVITAEPAGHLKARLQVGLLYENDAELATEATVTVTGSGPDGNTLASTPLPREEGAKYGVTLSGLANGPWTFTVVSENPTAQASASVEVVVSQSVSTTTPASTTTSATTTPDASTTTEALAAVKADDGSADDDDNLAVLAAIAIAALVGIAGIALYLRSRRSGDETSRTDA